MFALVPHRQRSPALLRWLLVCLLVGGALAVAITPNLAAEQSAATSAVQRCVPIEVFIRSDCPHSVKAVAFVKQLASRRSGIQLHFYDVLKDRPALERLYELSRKHQEKNPGVPSIIVAGRFLVGWDRDETSGRAVEDSLLIEVFTRAGCDHCRRAKEYLARLRPRYPAFEVRIYDIFAKCRRAPTI